jgi:nicotinamidase-related amidase
MPVSTLDPKAALVVVDLQKGLLGAPTTPLPMNEVVRQAARLARAFRTRGLPVVLVNVEGGAPGRTEAGAGGHSGAQLPADWSELAADLEAQPGDIRITKQRWNAFHGTALHDALSQLGVTQTVVTGVATSVGVEGTARGAYDNGYNVVLALDAMSDIDAAAHANSVERIFPRLGEIASVERIIGLLEERS